MDRRTFLQNSTAVAGAVVASTLAVPGLSLAPAQAVSNLSTKKTHTVLGNKIAYVDEGKGRPVVFLHGNPASSYLWRNIIPHVSSTHRAIAPDLIGMGDSDKPTMQNTYAETATHMFTFLDELDLEDAVLVIHDWGSALGWHYARTRPDRISAICFMEAMAPPFHPIPNYEALGPFEDFLRNINTAGVGEKLIMEDNYFLEQFMRHGSSNGPLSDAIMAEYNRYYPTAESRQILLDWPRQIPIAGKPVDVHEVVKANSDWLLGTTFPKLMFHVDPGAIIPMQLAEMLKQNLSNLETIYLGKGGHFLQEDHPDAIGKGLAEWLTRV
jgi:haloalkane dehalogenase